MKKILAFGASNSKNSINKRFAKYVAESVSNSELNLIDLNDYEMPLYGIDKENANGIPEKAHDFRKLIEEADGIVISFAEHNGSFSVAFKNVYDWASRAGGNVWQEKPLLLVSTSPGGRGGAGVLAHAYGNYAHGNKNTVKGIALPSFHDNFADENGIIDSELKKELEIKLKEFENLI